MSYLKSNLKMFNGIIFDKGVIKQKKSNKNSLTLTIFTKIKISNKEIGSSISCNGVCLTVVSIRKNLINFYLSSETLSKSNFSKLKIGDIVNLEKSLSFGEKISGHFLQGHIDTTGIVKNIQIIDKHWNIKIKLHSKYQKFLIEKGSIAINGVSLTINKVIKNHFFLSIIPHTLKLTNLQNLKRGSIVNIELDIFSKYYNNLSN
tara:strand:+ start:496 stop:1107 length:612 start_codon:yes stop_codon:yes gene_type:complete